MGHKPRRNKSIRHPEKPARSAQKLLEGLLAEAKIERMTQAEILRKLLQKHHGDIPVTVLWNHMADRREAVIRSAVRVGSAS